MRTISLARGGPSTQPGRGLETKIEKRSESRRSVGVESSSRLPETSRTIRLRVHNSLNFLRFEGTGYVCLACMIVSRDVGNGDQSQTPKQIVAELNYREFCVITL